MLIVRHRASGWVREIARKDEDALIEAHFDPESGVVTVYEGRPSSRRSSAPPAAPGLSRRACASTCPTGCSRSRRPPTRSTSGRPNRSSRGAWPASCATTRVEYAHALRHEAQALRHGAHEKLMRAFLDPEVFSGGVRVIEDEPADAQTRLSV